MQGPRVWPLALVLIALGVSVSADLFDGLTDLSIEPGFLAPVFAAWLGTRYGARAWRAFWIAAPLLLLSFDLNLGVLNLAFGLGADWLILSALALAAFSAPSAHAGEGAASSVQFAAAGLLVLGFLAAANRIAASGSVDVDYNDLTARASIGGEFAAMILAFWATASGRVAWPLALAAIVAASAALFGFALGADQLEWPMSADTAGEWGPFWLEAEASALVAAEPRLGAMAIAAALAGAAVAPLWRSGGRNLPTPSIGLIVAAWVAIFVLPAATVTPHVLRDYDALPFFDQESASAVRLAALDRATGLGIAGENAFNLAQTEFEEVTVTATGSGYRLPAFFLAGVYLALIAVWSLALGAGFPRRGAHLAPTAVVIGSAIAFWLQEGPQIFEYGLTSRLPAYAGAAAIAFVFASLAAEAARRRASSEAGE